MARFTSRAQIFTFDVIIAATAFLLLAFVFASLSRPSVSPARQEAYVMCLSGLEALKGNNTLSDVANGTRPESLLNSSLSQLPVRFGYELNLTTYSMSGTQAGAYYGLSGNLTDAELRGELMAVWSSFVTDNATPLIGKARLRCWVGK